MNYTDMDYLRQGQLKYMNPINLQPVQAEQTLAKKKLQKFLRDEMSQTNRYFFELEEEAEDYTIYEADKTLRRKIVRPELSIAKYACSTANKKIFFGAPS